MTHCCGGCAEEEGAAQWGSVFGVAGEKAAILDARALAEEQRRLLRGDDARQQRRHRSRSPRTLRDTHAQLRAYNYRPISIWTISAHEYLYDLNAALCARPLRHARRASSPTAEPAPDPAASRSRLPPASHARKLVNCVAAICRKRSQDSLMAAVVSCHFGLLLLLLLLLLSLFDPVEGQGRQQARVRVPGSGIHRAIQQPMASKKCSPQWFAQLGHRQEDRDKVLSQGNQDSILTQIFELVGETNRHCVEFGFGYVDPTLSWQQLLKRNGSKGGQNSRRLLEAGWNATFFDAIVSAPEINLIKAVLSEDNIVHEFRKAGIPTDVDYLSIDVDSIDLWLLLALLKGGYRPRVFTIEYNSNFNSTQLISSHRAWHPWDGTMVFGASAAAINMVAEMFGYKLIHTLKYFDMFYVRSDVLDAVCHPKIQPSFRHLSTGVTGLPFHKPCTEAGAARLVDFPLELLGFPDLARAKARATVVEMGRMAKVA
eukprot:6193934-Pleurochrysis_carterae.AAC.3